MEDRKWRPYIRLPIILNGESKQLRKCYKRKPSWSISLT